MGATADDRPLALFARRPATSPSLRGELAHRARDQPIGQLMPVPFRPQ